MNEHLRNFPNKIVSQWYAVICKRILLISFLNQNMTILNNLWIFMFYKGWIYSSSIHIDLFKLNINKLSPEDTFSL